MIEVNGEIWFSINRPGTCGASARFFAGYISNVIADIEHRGEGLGTELMQKIGAWADERNIALELHCRNGLITWYERFGFVHEGKDYWGNCMIRPPAEESD